MNNLSFKLVLFISAFFLIKSTNAQLVNNSSELQNAISNATSGSEIILANGTWNNVFIDINKNGTVSEPISISAQNPGSVFMTGNSRVYMRGSYLTISGLVFKDPSNLVVSGSTIEPIFELNKCNNCKVTNNKIDTYNGTEAQKTMKFKWIYIVDGQYIEISHNSFVGKYGIGSIINDNRSLGNADYLKIHHNYFADRTPINGLNDDNDQDAIRIGTSTTSLSDSFSEVYDNYFYNFFGEIEIISNKSGKNKYYNNTFRDYGGGLTLRHGNNCEVYGNYFFAENNDFTLGIRLIGEGHKVYNNYIEGINSFKPSGSSSSVTGGINVMNGVANPELNQYFQVKNAQVLNNTFVNCDYALRIGTSLGGDQAPENLTVANNIMYNTSIDAYHINTTPIGTSVSEGNITSLSNNDIADDGNFHRITSGSVAIDASVGTYSFLTDDILGGNRGENVDAGAEEFGANGENLPYKAADVGDKIGFLSKTAASLSTSKTTLNFTISESTASFSVNSNIDWNITNNDDWVTLNTTSGSNNETVNVTVSRNTSGASRTATITILENGGSLSTTVTINQSTEEFNTEDAVLMSNITVTGVGTQDPNIPENTLDNDETTRWSSNSNDGSAYLTYNLGCQKMLTSVKIYFHKGASRTSSFKIATSNDGINFTEVTGLLTSSGTTVGFENFELSPFKEVQYVRILGFGNSEESGWNSYEEVQFFGDNNCAILSVSDASFLEKGISFYPNPARNILNINAKNQIGLVEVYDLRGKSVLLKEIKDLQGNIETSSLSKGVYILKVKGLFSRFLVE